MKLYYIDDSMFQKSQFATQTLYRFERYVQKHACDVILISAAHEDDVNIERLRKSLGNVNVLVSPCLFDVEGVRGNLLNTLLAIEDFPSMQTFSGSFVAFDTNTGIVQRIYLELFIEHDFDVDYIVREMEQMLHEKIIKMKKKTMLS